MKRNKDGDFIVISLGILLCFLIYQMVLNQLPKSLSDFNGHTYVYLPMFSKETWFQGWKTVPYCMWHLGVLVLNHILRIPLEASAAYITCLFRLFTYLVIYWMIRRYTEAHGCKESSGKAAVIAFGLSFAQSLYLFWLDAGDRFLGTYSMNPLHNPTHISVCGFALICFCLVYDIWGRQKNDSYQGVFFKVELGLRRYYIGLAAALFLSAAAKPVFAEMFVPAVGIIMLCEWVGRILKKDGSAKSYFNHCVHMLLCAVPALLYILFQFLAYFFMGGSYGADGSFMVTKWMEVWSMYTENVILSIALGMAFPLFMVLIDGKFFVKDDLGKLAAAGYLIGLLEAALLGEGGSKLSHADFLWPMMCGMLLMWVTSMLRLLVLEKTQMEGRLRRILIDMAWVLFCIHVLCGILYVRDLTIL